REQIHDIGRRRAWAIWLVALSVYVLAIFHRSSLGVAGLLAAERFDIAASQLALFTVLQLVVYAGMQIPVGVLLDRFGSRALLLGGLLLMTTGQLVFALVTSFPAAVVARGLIGMGDAMVFISVLRLVAVWFLVRQAPLVTQLTGQFGQLGAVGAAAPLSWALHELGWTGAFGAASALGVALMVGVALLVRDSPYRSERAELVKVRALLGQLRGLWGNPGTRLGMWSHFVSQFSITVFSLLWGFPFLVSGQGLTPAAAAGLLSLAVVWFMVAGPVLAWVTTRVPYHRSQIVVGVVAVTVLSWTAVLLWPGPAPMPLLVLLVVATATGGPTSMVGFDLARTFTPATAMGRASGVVNIGGFVASLLTMAAVGIVLDLREPRGMSAYTLSDFKVALAVQYVVWGLGCVQVLRYRRKALDHLARMHPGAIDQMKRGEPFVHPGFDDREGV
ncbi:MAG TPA: MFS transporter, partial [Nocardioides sp.]